MIYDRKTILSLRLRSSTQLKKLTRGEFFSRFQLIRTVEPITDQAYKEAEEKRWREAHGDNPHGSPWHVSFHASQFPGDDPMACPRQALYRMMDLPSSDPFSRRSRTLMEVGKAMEVDLVRHYEEAGILLSAAPDEEFQTGFQVPEIWLTGSVDAVIKPRNWNKPLPIEIKSKDRATVEEMLVGARGPDPGHVSQIKVQLALVRKFQDELWPGLDPVTHGYIYYMSRGDKKGERKVITAEYKVEYDEKFFVLGSAQLKRWKTYFEEDFLPSVNPSKKHPMGWRWSYQPCQWCNFKRSCKLDFEAKETQLSKSVGIERAKLVRPEYDPQAARKRVLDRWKERKNSV
jgi:hypothetical protein